MAAAGVARRGGVCRARGGGGGRGRGGGGAGGGGGDDGANALGDSGGAQHALLQSERPDDGSEVVHVWLVGAEGANLVEALPEAERGVFWSENVYMVLYSYTVATLDRSLLYLWKGASVSQLAFLTHRFQLSRLLQQMPAAPVPRCIPQGEEPERFLAIMEGTVVLAGSHPLARRGGGATAATAAAPAPAPALPEADEAATGAAAPLAARQRAKGPARHPAPGETTTIATKAARAAAAAATRPRSRSRRWAASCSFR